MPWSKADNAQNNLETGLKRLLSEETERPETRRLIARYLPPGVESFKWIVEGEDEPPSPYGLLKKASQSRFNQGQLVTRRDGETGLRFREQWWRISIELHNDGDVLTERQADYPPLGAILNQMLDDLFMTMEGRAALAEIGVYNIKLTDEGDKDAGGLFSFDCSTDRFIEEAELLLIQ